MERLHRERLAKQKKTKTREVSVRNDGTVKLTETTGAEQEPGMTCKQTTPTVESRGVSRLNPDNTFKIEPIDPDDLPDFENLTRRRGNDK
jgi:hypothetical protein